MKCALMLAATVALSAVKFPLWALGFVAAHVIGAVICGWLTAMRLSERLR